MTTPTIAIYSRDRAGGLIRLTLGRPHIDAPPCDACATRPAVLEAAGRPLCAHCLEARTR